MSLLDTVLGMVTKKPKDETAPKPPVGSRSEREAKIKDKAGMVINVFALLLALVFVLTFLFVPVFLFEFVLVFVFVSAFL